MNWSSPSLLPLGAQPGALDSQFIFYTPPPQAEASSSSGPGLPRRQEDANSDQGGISDAEGELQSANRPQRRRAVGEVRPRRRNHGVLRQLVEGRDCDLTHLWEPSLRPRDHLPPPEVVYESFEHAVAGVTAWAKDHGLAYKKQKWARGGRYRLLMCCSRSGKCRERPDASASQPRRGAVSQRTDCKMQFWLMAVDYTQLDGQWRVKWCKDRASITHNHPPAHDVGSIAMYRRVTHSNNNELPGDVMSEEITITGFRTRDVRFPTSLDKTGSDAMNAACDYSSAYCILETNSSFSGHGMTFTIGRGNDIVCAAIRHVAERLQGKTLSSLVGSWGQTWRYLVSDSQLRWLGPEKGVIHLALGAVVNAIWDLWGKVLGKPVWKIVADMTPEQFVDCIDFRYITDALTPAEAVSLLRDAQVGKTARVEDALKNKAVPAYTTSAGWLGYGQYKMEALLRETLAQGYRHFKLKVGGNLEEDKRRLTIARNVIGYDRGNILMVDANQVWSVPEAIENMKQLAVFQPWFIEEPTSPDDIFGHKAVREALKPYGIGVATGEMVQNRVVFKQMLMNGAIDVCQIDACRLGGVNEVMAVLLLAKKYGVPVVPHSGGVGLPEYTQHLSTIDYVVVSGQKSVLEYVDHLHEHFLHPSVIKNGYYQTPMNPGYSVEMKPESMDRFTYPGEEGVSWWTSEEAQPILTGEKI
ncbi:uncharacterized protein CPUR_04208 [Claviceps purpurea 20.1]|uniref:Mandelate racemase/muconate lactonizing enzyme C-terminal domain-containing protein n=1 Tax=Claviceps purpurea (strain 20.1) TaxID=1111077 RepID=M1W678_CLAP2|nr:uncharacterized protein CPUR_04208 [Claviceps purpurea 20.1]